MTIVFYNVTELELFIEFRTITSAKTHATQHSLWDSTSPLTVFHTKVVLPLVLQILLTSTSHRILWSSQITPLVWHLAVDPRSSRKVTRTVWLPAVKLTQITSSSESLKVCRLQEVQPLRPKLTLSVRPHAVADRNSTTIMSTRAFLQMSYAATQTALLPILTVQLS